MDEDRGGRRGGGGGYDRGPRQMFDAVCADWGQATQVPFKPDPARAPRKISCTHSFAAMRISTAKIRTSNTIPTRRIAMLRPIHHTGMSCAGTDDDRRLRTLEYSRNPRHTFRQPYFAYRATVAQWTASRSRRASKRHGTLRSS